MMIDQELESLREIWHFTAEQLSHLRRVIANYAQCALMDTEIAKEAMAICAESEE
jgi:hypothetical protein